MKKNKYADYVLIGSYIKRYSRLYIILLFTVALFEMLLFIRELPLIRSIPLRHYLYLASYIILFTASLSCALFMINNRNKDNNEKLLEIVIHIYAFIALIWGVTVSLLDYVGGNEFPAVFFTILATIGGLLVLNPIIYVPMLVLSGVSIIVGMYLIDSTLLSSGNVINILVLYLMIAIVSYRTTAVAVSEEGQRNFLTKISNIDVLTGLKNENAYYRFLDKLDERLKSEKFNYAVIVMDVNGLKHTDDTYGHRYGAHLIQKAGEILPTIFKNCELFHTGGDEFVCVVIDEYDNLDKYLEAFERELEYGFINRTLSIENNDHNNLFEIIKSSDKIEEKEGIHYKNFYGTFALGPLLVKNPDLLKKILSNLIDIKGNYDLYQKAHDLTIKEFK